MEENIRIEETEAIDEFEYGLETQFSIELRDKYLSVIGDKIGKELKKELCELEASNFGYRSDLYIKTPDKEAVIIENQYGASDHDHFGKLFTYSANLYEESFPITNVVWILIEGNGKAKFHEGHYKAVEFINDFCSKSEMGGKFKIWLFIAEYKNNKYEFREPNENDIKKPGSREKLKPLVEFMVGLRSEIIKENYGNPWNGANEGWCLEFNPYQAEDYIVNIPYRKSEKRIYIEAKFNRRSKKKQNYVKMIKNNFEEDLKKWADKWCEENDKFSEELNFALYPVYAGSGKNETAKICSFINVDGIDDKNNWEKYIKDIMEHLCIILSFANYECEIYSERMKGEF